MSDLIADKKNLIDLGVVKQSKTVKLVFIISVVSVLAVSLIATVSVVTTNAELEKYQNGVIVIDNIGNIGSGHLATSNQNEIARIQADATLRIGVSNLYGFTGESFDQNMKLALPLFDRNGRTIYEGYVNDRLQPYLSANDIEVKCVIDSTNIEVGYIAFHQEWKKGEEIKKIQFNGSYDFERVAITESNTYGMRVVKWKTIEIKSE